MQQTFKHIADAPWFHHFITAVIVAAAVLVGAETYAGVRAAHHDLLLSLDRIVLGIFTLEIAIKMGAEGNRPWRYFRDPWNVFDFVIVAACYLPFDGGGITVLRLLRLLRVLKLLNALPKLRILVEALLRSIPSMFYVSVLLSLLFYVYAVAGVFLFGENDPVHFKDLQIAMVSLFRAVTLEDWTDLMYINMYGCENYGYGADSLYPCAFSEARPSGMNPVLGAAFFISFVLMGTMIVLNLFIGVIMGGMSEAQEEVTQRAKLAARAERGELIVLDDELSKLREDLARMQGHILTLERVARGIMPAAVAKPAPEGEHGSTPSA